MLTLVQPPTPPIRSGATSARWVGLRLRLYPRFLLWVYSLGMNHLGLGVWGAHKRSPEYMPFPLCNSSLYMHGAGQSMARGLRGGGACTCSALHRQPGRARQPGQGVCRQVSKEVLNRDRRLDIRREGPERMGMYEDQLQLQAVGLSESSRTTAQTVALYRCSSCQSSVSLFLECRHGEEIPPQEEWQALPSTA
jgi:hypothetical protein